MKEDLIRLAVKRYSPSEWREMNEAMHLAPAGLTLTKLEQWVNAPTEFNVPEGTMQFLEDWILGRFAYRNGSEKMVRVHNTPQVRKANVAPPPPPPPPPENLFTAGQGNTLGARVPGKPGRDIPDASKLKELAARRYNEEQEAKEKAKRGRTISLPMFGRN